MHTRGHRLFAPGGRPHAPEERSSPAGAPAGLLRTATVHELSGTSTTSPATWTVCTPAASVTVTGNGATVSGSFVAVSQTFTLRHSHRVAEPSRLRVTRCSMSLGPVRPKKTGAGV